jgi:hypothetical protein
MIVHKGKKKELTLRVVLESEEHGREYFDQHDSLDEMLDSIRNIVQHCIDDPDQIERIVGIAVVPKACYGDQSGYGYGLGEADNDFDAMTDGAE